MKYIISRYGQNIDWVTDYTDDYVLYDRSPTPLKGAIVVPNIGSDLLDKFNYIVDNYDNLPEVAVYTKANIFKFISKQEFDKIKDNKIFTPLLTMNHRTYMPICFYQDDIYWEINNLWYLGVHRVKDDPMELMSFLGISNMKYLPFAPGSNYILPKENILTHAKEFYQKLISYIDYDVYPGECHIIERALYTLWK